MFAIGLSQRLDAGVAVLLVDAARRIATPAVQTFLGHLILPGLCDVLNLPRSPGGV